MSADRNLLFAVLALQADCVTREQFIDACTAWAANKTTPIDALMLQKGWLTAILSALQGPDILFGSCI